MTQKSYYIHKKNQKIHLTITDREKYDVYEKLRKKALSYALGFGIGLGAIATSQGIELMLNETNTNNIETKLDVSRKEKDFTDISILAIGSFGLVYGMSRYFGSKKKKFVKYDYIEFKDGTKITNKDYIIG